MIVTEEYYGADADGNRGIWINNYELEDSDRDDVLQAVYDQAPELLEEEPVGGLVSITLTDDEGYDVEFEIMLEEWI